jgi:hypothetical protein
MCLAPGTSPRADHHGDHAMNAQQIEPARHEATQELLTREQLDRLYELAKTDRQVRDLLITLRELARR